MLRKSLYNVKNLSDVLCVILSISMHNSSNVLTTQKIVDAEIVYLA